MEAEKIILPPEKQKDIKFYMPEHKTLNNLSVFFAAFGDATRLKILTALTVSEMCVNDISLILNINQTTVSHQLKTLKSIGLVENRRDGKLLFYKIANRKVNDIMLNGVEYLMN